MLYVLTPFQRVEIFVEDPPVFRHYEFIVLWRRRRSLLVLGETCSRFYLACDSEKSCQQSRINPGINCYLLSLGLICLDGSCFFACSICNLYSVPVEREEGRRGLLPSSHFMSQMLSAPKLLE